MKSGEVDQSAAQAKEAVRLDPKSASARTTLGSALMVQGYVVPACNSYKEAVKLAPNDPNAHFLLSNSLEKSGEKEQAISELETFLKLAGDADPRAGQAKDRLTKLKSQ
jgi:cytochrome c-type biogenesis protein CcmH/NrfG